MSSDNLSTKIGRNGASSRSGVYDRQIMRTMRPVGAFKTTTSTATAEQSFWPYGTSAHGVSATSSTASAIDLIQRDHRRRSDRQVRCAMDFAPPLHPAQLVFFRHSQVRLI